MASYLRGQEVLVHDVHAGHRQAIRNARPIPPLARQVVATPPIPVTAWVVWERDGLEVIDTTSDAWSGRDVMVALRDLRWTTLAVWLPAQDVRRR